jgi:UDP-N-acetyl-2-amino-2-deoxyglucuronate dehydrogenase
MNDVKFAVVGCGNIGKRHLAVIDAEPRAEIVATCDIIEERAKHYAELYEIPVYFTDYEKMLKETDAEIVAIATPHGLHAPMAIAAAKAGKHILVEKPMALTSEDCHRMIDAAKAHEVDLFVVKQNRYNKPIALTQQAIKEGKLGEVYMVQCNVLWNRHAGYYGDSNWLGSRKLEGGALYTQVSHFIDLMVWWFGDVVETKTTMETKKQQVEIEDCGMAQLKFASGVLGNLVWTTTVYNKNYEGSITIVAEKGTIKIGGRYLNQIDFWDVQSYPLPNNITFDDQPNRYGKYQGTSSNHDKVVSNVIAKLLHERYDVVEGDEGIKSIEAIELIYKDTPYGKRN